VLGDGAMGTELLARGAAEDRNLSLLNLDHPELVLQVHRDYVAAGAELVRTNTFVASPRRLRERGVKADVREVMRAGIRLARQAAGDHRLVVGSVGPLGDLGLDALASRWDYEQQFAILAGGGCDALILETFTGHDDLDLALQGARRTGLPTLVQIASDRIVEEMRSHGFENIPDRFASLGAAVAGVNCMTPDRSAALLSRFSGNGPISLSAFPSAGEPGSYMAPEEFGGKVAPILDLGVRLVGGCCGTTPAHIRDLGARLAEKHR